MFNIVCISFRTKFFFLKFLFIFFYLFKVGPEAGGAGPRDEVDDGTSSEEERMSPRRTRRDCAGGPCSMAATYKSKAALRAANGKCKILLTSPTFQQSLDLLEISLFEVPLYLFLALI